MPVSLALSPEKLIVLSLSLKLANLEHLSSKVTDIFLRVSLDWSYETTSGITISVTFLSPILTERFDDNVLLKLMIDDYFSTM